MALGEAAAAIGVASVLLHTGRESSTAAVSSGRRITEAEALRAPRHGLRATSSRLGARPPVRDCRRPLSL
jgi:hypothetical protein